MVNAKIIYGYLITMEDIDEIFPIEANPSLYNNNGNLIDRFDVIEEVYGIIKAAIRHDDIKLYVTDFEFSTSWYGSNENRGDSTFIIGVEISKISLRYSGVIEIPPTSDDYQDILNGNIKLDFKYITPGFNVYVDSEK